MDANLKVSLSTITNPLKRYSTRATTNGEKKYLFEIVEGLGTAINEQHPPGFTMEDFTKACGVSPEWGAVAA
jgi:hypothetical protein